jgi:HD superfamily phosphohydrolase
MTYLVYPGALHTRFHHAIGALFLTGEAIETLRSKGHDITEEEAEAVSIAILLHDIGHSPFSHALENSLVEGLGHEDFSSLFMQRLNDEFKGALKDAISIFSGSYHKNYLKQLVSGQLDMDRLDYLRRDSFFTGVSEGVVSTERIIKMLDVYNDQLVVDAKGIYSIEKFIIARRLMYWQVYFHKTVLAAEQMLVKALQRAKELSMSGIELFATPALTIFLKNNISRKDFETDSSLLETFASLDDYDIFTSLKVWMQHSDPVLSALCTGLVNRQLYKCSLQNNPFNPAETGRLKQEAVRKFRISESESDYFIFTGTIANSAYNPNEEKINILFKDRSVRDIAFASDQLNISVLSGPVTKSFLCCHPALQ